METSVVVRKEAAQPSRRRLTLGARKAARAEEAVPRPKAASTRPPAKQREGGWGLYDWISWQDRMFPGLNSTQREPIACKICGIRSAMYYKLNSGTQFPSERVQFRCQLADLAMKVATGQDGEHDADTAKRLLDGVAIDMILIANSVANGTVKSADRKRAAKAVLLGEILSLQVSSGKGVLSIHDI